MNTQLLVALAHSAQATAQLAEAVLKDVKTEQEGVVLDKIFNVLEKQFGNTADAPKAEAPAEEAAAPAEAPATEEPASADVVVTADAVVAPIQIINDMLNDPRYTLRTIESITNKTGLDQAAIEELLDDNLVDYVVLERRRDSAPVIGLASRN